MRKLNENEVSAEFVSEWDGISTTICSPCIVNTKTKEIVKIYKRGREVYSCDESVNSSNVDDFVECLESEYVSFTDGTKSPACHKNYYSEHEGYWYQ